MALASQHSRYTMPIMFLILLLCYAPQPTQAFDLATWLWNPPYQSGGSLQDELQCFGLPYGGIGFASHLLTYYTIVMLAFHRGPLMPWRINRFWRTNIAVAIIALIITIVITVLTTIRCRNRWQFICLSVWKLDTSCTLGSVAIHSALSVAGYLRGYEPVHELDLAAVLRPNTASFAWWLLLYVPGVGAGLAGLLSLVHEVIDTNENVRTITIVFAIVAGIPPVVGLVLAWWNAGPGREDYAALPYGKHLNWNIPAKGVVIIFFLVFLLGPLYCDWILGAIAQDLVGVPSSDNVVLYWMYFAAKRLPGLAF